jgi:hypothetical protein
VSADGNLVQGLEYRRVEGVVEIGDAGLLRSTASRYWVRSLLPTDRKSTRRARARAWYTAEGTSTMTPIGGSGA